MSYPTVANTAGGGFPYSLNNGSRVAPFPRGMTGSQAAGVGTLNFAPTAQQQQALQNAPSMNWGSVVPPASAPMQMYTQPAQPQNYYTAQPNQPQPQQLPAQMPNGAPVPGTYAIVASGNTQAPDSSEPAPAAVQPSTKAQEHAPSTGRSASEDGGSDNDSDAQSSGRRKQSPSILLRIWRAFAAFVSKHPWMFLFLTGLVVAACVMLWLQYQQTNYMANGLDQLAAAAQNLPQDQPQHQVNIIAKSQNPLPVAASAPIVATVPVPVAAVGAARPLASGPVNAAAATVQNPYAYPYYYPYGVAQAELKGVPYSPYPYYWMPPYGYVPMRAPMVNQTTMVPVTSSTPIAASGAVSTDSSPPTAAT